MTPSDRPIVLGVDLDEVVFGYLEGLRARASSLGFSLPRENPRSWCFFESGWFPSREDFVTFHQEAVAHGLYEDLKPLPGAQKTLWDLSSSGYQINIITSRFVVPGQHQEVVRQTAAALDAHHIPYNNLSFLADKVLQHADAYLDDGPRNISALTEAGRPVIAFSMPYNEGIPSFARVTSWSEAREILRNRFLR